MSNQCTPESVCAPATSFETKSVADTARFVRPRVDLRETADAAILLVDLPGVAADGVELTVENGEFTITGRSALERPEGRVLLSEWAPVNYRRTFRLSDRSDVEHIDAKLEHGVLRVTIPKAQHARVRRIPVVSS